jgi:protein FAM32A
MMAAYSAVIGGKLKLKKAGTTPTAQAGQAAGAKRKASEISGGVGVPVTLPPHLRSGEPIPVDATPTSVSSPPPSSSAGSADAAPIKASADGLTAAQRSLEEAQRRREKELVKKMVSKSHRQKVEDLNNLLATMPEHHDIPKISYAGIG